MVPANLPQPPPPPPPPPPSPPPPPLNRGQIYGVAAEEFKRKQYRRKYVGYNNFSKWIASDSAFFVLRRFGTLNARVALSMQDKIVRLEEELENMDRTYSDQTPGPIDNGSFRDDPFSDRKDLIEKTLPCVLMKYNAFINSYSQLLSRPEIHSEDLESVKTWMRDPDHNKDAINPLETSFIDCHDDLIGIQPKSRSWFRNVLESSLLLKTPGIRNFFERRPREYDLIRGQGKGKTIWQNDKRVEGFSAVIIAFVGLGMLIGPLWALSYIQGQHNRLACITAFIALFFVLVAVATTARVFDALAAAAAYSAVLMVFLQVGII